VKLEQYAKGEAFVSAIAAAGGSAALNRLWAGPEMLPRPGEIENPAAWLARVGGSTDAAQTDPAQTDPAQTDPAAS
jgi:uncharacterized protein (DUF2342 family)